MAFIWCKYPQIKVSTKHRIVIVLLEYQCGVLEHRALSSDKQPALNPTIAQGMSRRRYPSCTTPLKGKVVMSYTICGGCYQCAFSGQYVLPVFSACPWSSDVLVALISRGARHSLLRIICWEWSNCLFCANQEHMERIMDERLLEGQIPADSIWILVLSEGTGVLRWLRSLALSRLALVHFIQFHQFLNLTLFFPQNVSQVVFYWLLLPGLFFGACFVFHVKAQVYTPALCSVFTQLLNSCVTHFCCFLPWRDMHNFIS